MTRVRSPLFDTLRGFAMILMAIFHFCFDLNVFHVISSDFNQEWFWYLFRGVIMWSFMLLAGISLVLSDARYSHKKFWQRLLKVAGCAVLISISTYLIFGSTWIFFGVLHFLTFATLLGPLLVRVPILGLPVGLGFILLPELYTSPWFHTSWWRLLGLSPWPILTEDYAPIFPWLGVVMVGIFIGSRAGRWPSRVTNFEVPKLSLLGHHALLFYMTHQVVLYPLAWLISRLR